MAVRVLRLLEYTFENNEAAEEHLGRLGVPANGTKRLFPRGDSPGMIIKSAIITDFAASWLDPSDDEKLMQRVHDVVSRDSLARDGWEMIESALRDNAGDDDANTGG